MDHPSSAGAQPTNAPTGADNTTLDAGQAGAAPEPYCARRPVSVRLSDEERRLVGKAAAGHGEPPSRFLRNVVLEAAGEPLPAVEARRDALARGTASALGLLGRIASSANQIARAANAGALRPRDVEAVLDTLNRQLREVRRCIVEGSGARDA